MKTRRIAKSIAAALLAVGVFTVGAAPVGAAEASPISHVLNDTGWG